MISIVKWCWFFWVLYKILLYSCALYYTYFVVLYRIIRYIMYLPNHVKKKKENLCTQTKLQDEVLFQDDRAVRFRPHRGTTCRIVPIGAPTRAWSVDQWRANTCSENTWHKEHSGAHAKLRIRQAAPAKIRSRHSRMRRQTSRSLRVVVVSVNSCVGIS